MKKKHKVLFAAFASFFVLSGGAFAENGMNSWLDLPVIQTIEYFTVLCANAMKWAWRYAALFGAIGIAWSAVKVMTSRMQVKQMFWDTTLKWFGFTVLLLLWPSITYGFLGMGIEIGEKAGIGKNLVEQDLRTLYSEAKAAQDAWKRLAEKISKTGDPAVAAGAVTKKAREAVTLDKSYSDVMASVRKQWKSAPVFNSGRDAQREQDMIDKIESSEEDQDPSLAGLFSMGTLAALNSVLTEKNADGSDGDDLKDTFIQLKCYLVDEDGKDTAFISPSAMIRLAVVCGMVMYDKWKYEFNLESNAIDNEEAGLWGGVTKNIKGFVHWINSIPEMIELIFCWFVLIAGTVFAMIQYVMTIIEFTIVTSLAAMFLPLMLFDGTKDIPKKFIPVFIGMMIKIICVIVCLYFSMYLLTEHAINTITEHWGMNLMTVAEVFFIAALCYVLTQNAPKIAQTILTGQPQLSMGEALQGAGTAAVTGIGTLKGATMATRAGANAGINTLGNIAAAKGAADSAKAQGKDPKKAFAQTFASEQFAKPTKDLVRRFKEGGNKFLHGKTSSPLVDKAVGRGTWNGDPDSAGGGQGAGGGQAQSNNLNPHERSYEEKNRDFKTAKNAESMKHKTIAEFIKDRYKSQNPGNTTADLIDNENEKKAEQGGGLPNLDGMDDRDA